ncbi:hypothetical protein GCM10009853_034480 [Glycomyces scopariae]
MSDLFDLPDGPEGPRERGRMSLPDSPIVAGITAGITMALAVVLFITAMPGENRVLVYQGERVNAGDLCEAVGTGGETVVRACAELGTWESYPTGWSLLPLLVALVLAGAAGYVAYHIPKQVRTRKQQVQDALDNLTGEDFKRL